MKKKNFSSRTTVLFKKFQRKPYAVFNSLKQIVHIAVLPAACLVFAHTSNALAQASNMTSIEHNLQEIEVLGEESSMQMGRVSGIVSVINKDEIALTSVQTIQDLLEYVSSVDVRQRGGNGVQADISIRGNSSDQILILLNGVNITDPQTGHHNLNLPIDLSSVSRIEILQGSGSRVLGAATFGGAINIITGESSKNEINVEVIGGDHGYVFQNADGTLKTGAFSNFISLSRQRSNGYIDNTDFDIINTFLHGTYSSPKAGKFQLQFGFQDKGFGSNSFYSFAYPNQYEQLRTFISSLSWNKEIFSKTNLTAQAYWRESHDRFELFRDFENAASFYQNHNYHQTDIFGGLVRLERIYSSGKTTIGTGVRNEHIFSNVLGEKMGKTRKVPFEKNAVFTHEKNRFLLNVFADQIFYFNKITIAGGAAFNYSEDYDSHFSGGFDFDYQLFPKTKLYACVNHAFRLPTFTDLYYNNATHISNPNLKPEKAAVFETGMKFGYNNLKTNISLYYRMASDVIDWIKTPESDKWESRNHTDINAIGGDLSAQYFFRNIFIRKIQLSYSYLYQDKNAGNYDSKYALDYLKHKAAFGIHHNIYKNISMNWNFVFQDRNGDFADFATNEKVEYKPFFVTDVKLQWAKEKISVYVDVNNLFDKKHEDFGGLPQSGRWIKTGIKVKIN